MECVKRKIEASQKIIPDKPEMQLLISDLPVAWRAILLF